MHTHTDPIHTCIHIQILRQHSRIALETVKESLQQQQQLPSDVSLQQQTPDLSQPRDQDNAPQGHQSRDQDARSHDLQSREPPNSKTRLLEDQRSSSDSERPKTGYSDSESVLNNHTKESRPVILSRTQIQTKKDSDSESVLNKYMEEGQHPRQESIEESRVHTNTHATKQIDNNKVKCSEHVSEGRNSESEQSAHVKLQQSESERLRVRVLEENKKRQDSEIGRIVSVPLSVTAGICMYVCMYVCMYASPKCFINGIDNKRHAHT
jgi:hypothetical protein